MVDQRVSSFKYRVTLVRQMLERDGMLSISQIAYTLNCGISTAYALAKAVEDLYDDVLRAQGMLILRKQSSKGKVKGDGDAKQTATYEEQSKE